MQEFRPITVKRKDMLLEIERISSERAGCLSVLDHNSAKLADTDRRMANWFDNAHKKFKIPKKFYGRLNFNHVTNQLRLISYKPHHTYLRELLREGPPDLHAGGEGKK